MTKSLIDAQSEIERDILDMGVTKLKGISSECICGVGNTWLHVYVKEMVWPVSEGIMSAHTAESVLKRKRPIMYYVLKDGIDPFAVAVCALFPLIKGGIQGRAQLVTVCEEMGRSVAEYSGKVLDKFKNIRAGLYLLNIVHDNIPGLFVVEMDKSVEGDSTYMINFSEGHNLKVIRKCISLILGRYSPMLVKPEDWSSTQVGGYTNSSLSTKVGLVRRRQSSRFSEVYKYENMPDVYNGVNFIQSTPFKINGFILDVFRKCVSTGADIDELPGAKPMKAYKYPLPKGLKKGDMNAEQLATLRKWASINTHIKKERQRYNSKMFTIKVVAKVASGLLELNRFFFPHNMDYRGRLYPIPVIFNLQGSDYIRAMLLFADGKQIMSQSGADWLAIHGANCYGQDKVSFSDRIQWVKSNELAITLAYADPLNSTFWQKAKDPFQFLAFCKEWAGYRKHGYDYVCNLPIGVDATCSGLQHYSAMLKDPVGGRFVNLIQSDEPQDIYQEVADKLITKLKQMGDGEISAVDWLSVGITRSTTKRVVMTTVYSLTKYKSREYVQEYLLDKAPNKFEDPSKASAWLAEYLWDAVGEVIKGARLAMDYIKGCAKKLSGVDQGIEWSLPSGFKVNQLCTKSENKRINELHWLDKEISLTVLCPSDKIDKRAQVNAICPNVIHSLDSCHLIMVANRAKDVGITHFASIHDCFYTHPCDVKLLGGIIRESFVDMYDGVDFLSDFKAFLENRYNVKMAPPPSDDSMDLDVRQVLSSDYFFS